MTIAANVLGVRETISSIRVVRTSGSAKVTQLLGREQYRGLPNERNMETEQNEVRAATRNDERTGKNFTTCALNKIASTCRPRSLHDLVIGLHSLIL
jgi:hypothetical protein